MTLRIKPTIRNRIKPIAALLSIVASREGLAGMGMILYSPFTGNIMSLGRGKGLDIISIFF